MWYVVHASLVQDEQVFSLATSRAAHFITSKAIASNDTDAPPAAVSAGGASCSDDKKLDEPEASHARGRSRISDSSYEENAPACSNLSEKSLGRHLAALSQGGGVSNPPRGGPEEGTVLIFQQVVRLQTVGVCCHRLVKNVSLWKGTGPCNN
jgi:hypothetical protein